MSFMMNEDKADSLEALLSSELQHADTKLGLSTKTRSHTQSKLLHIVAGLLALSLLANIGLSLLSEYAISELHTLRRDRNNRCQPHLYSPAEGSLESKLTKFDSAVEDGKTPYQGRPTPEKNALWEALYRHMNSHISAEEANLLPNKTAPEPAYEGSGYLVILNVFHDLHCLDSIRHSVWYFLEEQWNNTYNPYTLFENPTDALYERGGKGMSIDHVDHCIDVLRQSTQCNTDITPNVYQYSPKAHQIMARGTVVHECRNFDRVNDWAKQHETFNPVGMFGDGPELGKCAFEDNWTCLYE